jgi:hypothetical protein
MTILHYSLTKLSKRRVSGSIKLFIYSNEHFEMAQGQKSGWKEGGKPCFVQFFKNQDKFKKQKKWKNIKFLFLIFFLQKMQVWYIYFKGSSSFCHETTLN